MTTQVGRLAKNRVVRDLHGNIIDWFDEARGGWIIQKRAIVRPDIIEEEQRKERDKQEAAKAHTMAKVRKEEDYPLEAPGTNKKITELETKVADMDNKLDAILNALKK